MLQLTEETYGIQEDIIKWRRELHKIPELDLYLPKTSKYVIEELNKRVEALDDIKVEDIPF